MRAHCCERWACCRNTGGFCALVQMQMQRCTLVCGGCPQFCVILFSPLRKLECFLGALTQPLASSLIQHSRREQLCPALPAACCHCGRPRALLSVCAPKLLSFPVTCLYATPLPSRICSQPSLGTCAAPAAASACRRSPSTINLPLFGPWDTASGACTQILGRKAITSVRSVSQYPTSLVFTLEAFKPPGLCDTTEPFVPPATPLCCPVPRAPRLSVHAQPVSVHAQARV